MQSQQIRRPLPRTVTSLSLRYPQLLCVLAHFRKVFTPHRAQRRLLGRIGSSIVRHRDARSGLTMRQRAGAFCVDPEQPRGLVAIFINSKPRRRLFGGGESPLSALAAV
jgi:hypothetical protein